MVTNLQMSAYVLNLLSIAHYLVQFWAKLRASTENIKCMSILQTFRQSRNESKFQPNSSIYVVVVYSDPNNTNSIVYQHTLVSNQLKTSLWNCSRAATLHLCNMADRGKKLQPPHCYHPFSDSRDTYLTKNHYENYSPKMVLTNPTGSWTMMMSWWRKEPGHQQPWYWPS